MVFGIKLKQRHETAREKPGKLSFQLELVGSQAQNSNTLRLQSTYYIDLEFLEA
jgi:hypothetical protein